MSTVGRAASYSSYTVDEMSREWIKSVMQCQDQPIKQIINAEKNTKNADDAGQAMHDWLVVKAQAAGIIM